MPRYVCKLDGLYFEWSTIVGAPITRGMSLSEFEDYYQREYGRSGLRDLPQRLDRADAKGTSSHIHHDLDELIAWNRAGRDESCATRDEIAAMLRPARVREEKGEKG